MVAHRTKAHLSNKIKVKRFHILIDILLILYWPQINACPEKSLKGKGIENPVVGINKNRYWQHKDVTNV